MSPSMAPKGLVHPKGVKHNSNTQFEGVEGSEPQLICALEAVETLEPLERFGTL